MKKIIALIALATVAVAACGGSTPPEATIPPAAAGSPGWQVSGQPTPAPAVVATPSPKPQCVGKFQDDPAPEGKTDATIVKWIDGDTLDVKGEDGKVVRVRMLGINAPELKTDDGKAVKKYAVETWPVGSNVWLEIDPKQDRIDKYDRLLRHVWRPSNIWISDPRWPTGCDHYIDGVVSIWAPVPPLTEGVGRLMAADLAGIKWADVALTYKTYGKTSHHSLLVEAKQEIVLPPTDDWFGEHPTCAEHRANGEGPFYSGDAEYEQHQDRDDDGVVCE